jgi:hypothetical protein
MIGVTWWAVTKIETGVGDLVQRIRDGQAHVEYSVARWSGGQVTLCAVCTVHNEMRSVDFLVEPQNQGWRISWLSLRTKVGGFLGWASKSWLVGFLVWTSKPAAAVWWFRPQNHCDGFLVGPQNQAGDGLSVAPQNRREEDGVGHTSRSSGFFYVQASRARVSQFASKLAEWWWVVHVASS